MEQCLNGRAFRFWESEEDTCTDLPGTRTLWIYFCLFVVSFALWDKVMIHRPKIINMNRNGDCLISAMSPPLSQVPGSREVHKHPHKAVSVRILEWVYFFIC